MGISFVPFYYHLSAIYLASKNLQSVQHVAVLIAGCRSHQTLHIVFSLSIQSFFVASSFQGTRCGNINVYICE